MKAIHLAVLIAGLCSLTVTSEAQTSGFITNGLIAYFPLNGTANDESGFGHNGTVYGATLTSNRFGLPGMAYEFNGTSDYIAANIPNLPTNSEPRSISLWAKSANPENTSCLLFWGTSANREGFGIIGNGTPHTWQGQTWGGGDDVNSGVAIDANWHQIVVVYDGSVLSICIDGAQKGTLSEGINTGFSPLSIGADTNNNAPNQFFNGAISDVRIYNRALATQEIAALYGAELSVGSGIVLVPTITIQGSVGMLYDIEYTTNLSFSSWTPLTNVVLETSNYLFPDFSAIGQPQRFYLVVPQ